MHKTVFAIRSVGVTMAAWIFCFVCAGFAAMLCADEPSAEEIQFFEQRIRPVLVEHCYKCHSAEAKEVEAGLLLDSRAGILAGGETGKAVVPGDAKASLLIQALHYDKLEMPPDSKLPDRVIADFEKWIDMGAPDPRDTETGPSTEQPQAEIDWVTARKNWAFQTPQKSLLPDVKRTDWPESRIDFFVLARLEQAGLEPSEVAEKQKLIRRVTFDLTGLPPAETDVRDFLEDQSPDAYEKVVARLLASPRYGEHRARLWLDVARYAEDQAHIVGENKELFYPNAHVYRDWVINALNADMTYDRFIKLQLAADLTESPADPAEIAALGFLGLGPKYYRRNDPAVMADEWEDRIDVVSRGLLGLTVACARCHDHKFDPIETEDYYALAGVFASTEMFNQPLENETGEEKQKADEQAKDEAKEKDKKKKPDEAIHIVRDKDIQDVNVFIRGDVNSKGEKVPRRFITLLSTGESPQPFKIGSGRLELAEAIVDPANPLTSRVIVNRVWGRLMGKSIVGTPSNFGKLGAEPTHPELLDDLAARFVENGQSLKWLHHEIVTSATYRQASDSRVDAIKRDPDNRLMWRMNRRRLSVEQWRDALLLATEHFERQIGGKSAKPSDPESSRRTIYSNVSRFELDEMLKLFDFPDPNAHCEVRAETTSPLQKMYVMNGPFMVAAANRLAKRLTESDSAASSANANAGVKIGGQIERAYWLLLSRPPSSAEKELALRFLDSNQNDPEAAWQKYVHALIASNEFYYLD